MNFDQINSATKYPSIETYHKLDPKNGNLLEEPTEFDGPVVATEKVDGGNGRIIFVGNDWFIGSREEITYAKGDRIINPMSMIVPTLLPLVDNILDMEGPNVQGTPGISTYYFEVYGYKLTGNSKQYTKTEGKYGARLFDVSWAPTVILDLQRESISRWRQDGGQKWDDEPYLQHTALEAGIELTPRLGTIAAEELPGDIEGMYGFLQGYLPKTGAALDDTALGRAEGIVFRNTTRSIIAKAKFQDYERTLDRRAGKRK
jgi:hypothetical protein